ncbi:hypothetical protein CROQUDRAFT_663177 [Cronartium quercuum f. sp. fusiforme G11]|uniref:S-adenosyl-L-methionine-dependent methyltransferase n=1 Tax=Cronartium quercuum f. sp. fusiforme G11 TaxID=708437 RepID=A0A9P6ND04_9BASI|nr:hypothetical protein CROQUDRAFT_663177 [Cronartium quercuum f. sp. fusiforme G11]
MSVILVKKKKHKLPEQPTQTHQNTFDFNLTQSTSTFSISIHSLARSHHHNTQAFLRFTPALSAIDPSSSTYDHQPLSIYSLASFIGLRRPLEPTGYPIIALPLQTKPFRILSDPEVLRSHPAEKIQHFDRIFHSAIHTISPTQITECPNGSSGPGIGGNHIWDCSVVMAWLFDSFPQLVTGDTQLSRAERTLDLEIIELGSGCGLAALTAARLLDHHRLRARIILTDLEEVISTSLAPNVTQTKVRLTKETLVEILTECCIWGSPSSLPPVKTNRSLILANDVLYNPENQAAFLHTVLQLFDTRVRLGQSVSALLGYRPRTEGDHEFFQTAKQAGLVVERIARIGTVHIFKLSPSPSFPRQ